MKYIIMFAVFIVCLSCTRQEEGHIVTLQIEEPSALDLTANLILPEDAFNGEEKVALYKTDDDSRIKTDIQKDGRNIYWILEAPVKAGTYTYELVNENGTSSDNVKAVQEDGGLTISSGEQKLLTYQYETMYPPEGVDSVFKRSAFIHPLWAPHGQVLTRIQPPDHYHHYGIWNPWTHVYFEGDTLDFWNLAKGDGTVRFAGFESITEGPVYSEYAARHDHVVFKEDGSERTALKEIQKVRVYRPEEDTYLIDFTIDYTPATESPFKILEYRYAGFSWRAPEVWDNSNSMLITSAGKNRAESDGSLAKWYMIQGELGDDYGGAVVMSHPENFNHPEPLRVWPVDIYNRGDVFACFCTTKNTDWVLEPGESYTLKYRMLVFNGEFNPEKAEDAWQHYAEPVMGSLTAK